jgi:hypothetical protein
MQEYYRFSGILAFFTSETNRGADGFLSGPSAQTPNKAGREEGSRHRKVCADGDRRHKKGRQHRGLHRDDEATSL